MDDRSMNTLVRLVRVLVSLDHELTREEVGSLLDLGPEVDAEKFWHALSGSFKAPLTLEGVLEDAAQVKDPNMQRAFMHVLEPLAASDELTLVEAELLSLLRKLWDRGA